MTIYQACTVGARWSEERADDGAKFIATAVQEWLARTGVKTLSIALGWIRDNDEVILAAYRSSPRRLPEHRALWEARSGHKLSWWSIWDGEHFTGELLADRSAAEVRLLQLSIARSQPRAARVPAND